MEIRARARRWLFVRLSRVDDWVFDHTEKVWDRTPWGGLQRLACAVLVHVPIPDQCGRPDHDFCAYCGMSMPGRA